jgi:putative ABC transport system substrate-binding protein
MPDPVGLGFAASLARPGGNVTGLANLFEEITPKQLQALPRNGSRLEADCAALRSQRRGPHPRRHGIGRTSARTRDGYVGRQGSARSRTRGEVREERAADGILVLPSPFLNRYRARIATLAIAQRLPTIGESAEYVVDGGLLSYGPSFPQMYFRAAAYVDRILRGEKPGDLPIERPTTFELVVNQKTAKRSGS